MKLRFALTIALLATSPAAFASSTWCAVVNHGIPDDYLNVRFGPGVEYEIIERIYPGDTVGVSAARCGLDAFGKTLCTGASSDWRFLELKLADGSLTGAAQYHGWINSIYVTEVPCGE
jgi:hypothetical protein